MLGANSVWPRLSQAFLERGRFLAALGAVEEALRSGADETAVADVRRRVEERLGAVLAPWQSLVSKSPG